jgi:hypothetical protein
MNDIAWETDSVFVSAGPNHFRQWTISEDPAKGGLCLKTRLGNFGDHPKVHVGCVFNRGTCLTGSIAGSLYLWQGTSISRAIKLHESPEPSAMALIKGEFCVLEAICVTESHIFTGGRDQRINVLSASTYKFLFRIDCKSFPDSIRPRIRAITINAANDTLMVGTFGHEIYEVPVNLSKETSEEAI